MSEKHKAYLLIIMVMIAAVVAYVRFFREASETSVPDQAPGKLQRETDSRADAKISQRPNGKATAIMPLRTAEITRDLFAPTGPLPDARPSPATITGLPPIQTLKLSGTVLGDNVSLAIINNRFLKQGQEVGGFRVEKIAPDRVYLVSGKHTKVLEVMALEEAIQ